MTPEKLFNDIQAYCQANGDEALVKKYSRYFKDGYDAYGLNHDKIVSKVKSVLDTPGADLDYIIEF